MRLTPEIVFKVNLLSNADISSPDIAVQLPLRTVYLPISGANGPYHHGDLIMLSGQQAIYLRNIINQVNNVELASDEDTATLFDSFAIDEETDLVANSSTYLVWKY